MEVNDRLNVKFYEHPQLCLRLIIIIFKLLRNGFFSIILKLNLWPRTLKTFIKILIFLLEKNNNKNVKNNLSITLSDLGPGFIKLGQTLSTRPDMFGLKITEKLVYLQDNVKPCSFNEIKKIIEQETESKINELFSKLIEKPIATASVAQVHEGTLLSGERIAIKILRPNIENLLFKDFKFFFWLSGLTEIIYPKIKKFKLPEMVRVFASTSLNEVDLKLEAAYGSELNSNFINFKKFRIPKIYWELTTKKILTLEYINGVRIDDINKIKKKNLSVNKLIKLASEIFFLQVFRDGFFHADLHPGNIFVDDAGAIVALDFGIMGRLANQDRKFLAELLINLLEKNFSKVTKLHYDFGMLGDNVSHELLTQEIRAISTPIIDKPIGRISLANLMGEILTLSNKFDIRIQPKFALLQKTMVMAEGIARQINPDANMWKLTKPLVEKWIKENYDPFNTFQDWLNNNEKIIREIPKFFHKLNKLLEKILEKS